jgi:hypothetical protein
MRRYLIDLARDELDELIATLDGELEWMEEDSAHRPLVERLARKLRRAL